MKITDLRIGNYIRSKHSGQIIQVYELFQEDDGDIVNDSLIDSFEPLPIDVEIFKRLGGVENIYHPIPEMGKAKCFEIDIDGLYVLRFFPDNSTCFLWDEENNRDPQQIIGVHRLQNIFYALTGEELVLKMH